MKKAITALLLCVLFSLPAAAADPAAEPTPATTEIPEYQGPDLTLTEDKLFGDFTFWRQTDDGYENGFVTFAPDQTWMMVVHLDRDHDKVSDRNVTRRGAYAVGRRAEDNSLGLYLEGEGLPRVFLEEMVLVGGKVKSFAWEERQFQRRSPTGPYFVLDQDLPDRAAELRVESAPAGAMVLVDGQQMFGTTPLLVKKPAAGVPLTIEVVMPKYRVARQVVTLVKDETRSLRFELMQGEAALKVESLPRVKVRLDGEFLGVTPVFRDDLPAGQHALALYNESLDLTHAETIVLEKGKTLRREYRFTGRLVLEVGRNCRILRGDREVGAAPFAGEVPIGRHVLTLIDDRGERRVLPVLIERDRTLEIRRPFEELAKP